MQYEGADHITSTSSSITVYSVFGSYIESSIEAYQLDSNDNRIPVSATIVSSAGNNQFTFLLGSYNSSRYLIIQMSPSPGCNTVSNPGTPITSRSSNYAWNNSDWSTFYGGIANDRMCDMQVDISGNVYTYGGTQSTAFPKTAISTVPYNTFIGESDCFLSKFDKFGKPLFATYFGGTDKEFPKKIALASNGDIWGIGVTLSGDMPIRNASSGLSNSSGTQTGFAFRFTNDGQFLKFSRYINTGNSSTHLSGLAIDGNDNVYIVGNGATPGSSFYVSKTGAFNYNITSGATYPYGDYILEFNNSNTQIWGTYFNGGNIYDVAIGASNKVYLVGSTDATTMAGGTTPCGVPSSLTSFPDCNPGGTAYHQSGNNGNSDYFIAEFSSGGELLWSTLFGGPASEIGGTALGANAYLGTYAYDLSMAINPLDKSEITVLGNTDNYNVSASTISPVYTGGEYHQSSSTSGIRMLVTKFKNREQKWLTSFGEQHYMEALNVVYDHANNIYIGGFGGNQGYNTYSSTTCGIPGNVDVEVPNCASTDMFFQQNFGGEYGSIPITFSNAVIDGGDAYFSRFSSNNQLSWGSLYGGDDGEFITCSAFDATNHYFYIGGFTTSICNFPLRDPQTQNYMQPSNANINVTSPLAVQDAFIARFKVVEATTGIASQNQDKLQNVKVYPNPTQNILNLEFSSSEERNVKIEVIDLTGKIIQSSVIDRNIGLIHYDLNSLSSGVYILKIQSANINESVKFVKTE